jgi:hypothetical protein
MTRLRRALPLLVVAALFALGTSLGLQKIREFDYWWHARTGRLIAETGSVPKHDVYTYTVPGNRWVDIHWLFQLGLHGVRRLGGHGGVVAAKALGVGALVALLLPIGWRRERAFLSGLAIGLALLLAGDRFEPRPELPSFALLAAFLLGLDRHERRGGWGVLALVPLQLVWANVHGLFALGLALLAIALAAEGLRPVVVPGARLRRDHLLPLAVAAALALAISLVNPNGVDGLLYPIQQLRMVGPESERGVFGSLISELLPTFGGDQPLAGLALVLTAALAGLSLGALAANWRRASVFDALVWLAFAWLAAGARRNVSLFALVAAPIAVRNANAFLDRHPLPPAAAAGAQLAVALALALATVDVARDRFFARIGSSREAGLGTFDFFYPVGAVDWIAREKPPGPICHNMANGGYLIDRLWPAYPDMVDGRLEVFGPETFAKLQVGGPERFRALDAEYHFGTVLVQYSLFDSRELLRWLHLNPNWRLVHLDETAALFVRDGPAAGRWPRLDPGARDLFPPLSGSPSPSDLLRRQARINLFLTLSRFPEALALWEETAARYPAQAGSQRVVHAYLLRQNGFAAAAEAILREELEARPDDAGLRAELGDLRLESGDPGEARSLYDAALALDPNHPYALRRRAQLAESEGDVDGAAYYRARLHALSVPLPGF